MSTKVLFYKDRFVAPLLAMTCFSTFYELLIKEAIHLCLEVEDDTCKGVTKIRISGHSDKGQPSFFASFRWALYVVPVHRGESIGRGLLAQILRDCEISRDDLKKLL